MKNLYVILCLSVAALPSVQAQDFAAAEMNPFSLTAQGSRSAPAFADLDDDDDLDFFMGRSNGEYGFFENAGAATLAVYLTFELNPFSISAIGSNTTPFLVDLDDDNDYDIMTGGDGGLRYYVNGGTAAVPYYGGTAGVLNPFSLVSPSGIIRPYMVDIDDDGDMDLFVGATDGNIYYYQNTGTASSATFAASVTNPFGLKNAGERSAPAFADVDSDGDLDAVIGNKDGDLFYYRNTGTATVASFDSVGPNLFNLSNNGQDAKPCFADLDNDGDPDLMVGTAVGDYYYFKNTTVTGIDEARPIAATIYPNPSAGHTIIQLSRPVSRAEQLIVTDLAGREVMTLYTRGEKQFVVDGRQLGGGVFLAYLQSAEGRRFLGEIVVK